MRYLLSVMILLACLMNVRAQGRRIVTSDGTNLYVVTTNGAVATTNILTATAMSAGNIQITTNGIVVTNNYQEDDLKFPAQAIRAGGIAPPSYTEMFDGLYAYSFSKTSKQTYEGVAQFPHSMATTESIEPHLHCTAGTFTNGGTSVWSIVWAVQNKGQSMTGITITNTSTNVMIAGTNWQDQYYTLGTIPNPVHKITNASARLIWRVSRETSDPADTQDSDIWVQEFDIHYYIKYPCGKNP